MSEVPNDLAGWTDLSLEQPPEHCGSLLVTNNIRARDAFGHMSHIWLVSMVHEKDGEFTAFYETYRTIHGLTHWRYAVPTEDARHRTAGQAELVEALTLCADQLAQIREANDPDDADSYRSDDREGCLDWTFAASEEAEKAAKAVLAPLSQSKGEG